MTKLNNEQELHFTRHLFSRIKGDLTGSEVPELLNDGPRERLHAGVLLPLELELPRSDGGSSLESLSGDGNPSEASTLLTPKVDSDSIMSMDFQVRLPEGSHHLVLKIEPHFSVYYAVFPSRADVLANQQEGQADIANEENEEDGDGDTTDTLGDPELQKTFPDEELVTLPASTSIPQQLAAVVIEPLQEVSNVQETTVILLRKFRRYQVEVPPIEITVDPEKLIPLLEYRGQLDAALAEARDAIAKEPELWRHLGAAAEGRRELKGINLLASDEDYARALRKAAQGDLALPTWRAYMTISGEETLMAYQSNEGGRVYRLNVALVNSTASLPKNERQRAQLEEGALFDCGFSVELGDGELVPFEFQGAAKDYRHERSFDAIGSNCVALAQESKEHSQLYTETVPLYEQPWYRTRNDLPVDFSELDDNPNNQALDKLTKLHLRMGEYLAEWVEYLQVQAPGELTHDQISACSQDMQNFAEEVKRFWLGVEALKKDKNLLRAFRLMNRVFRENGESRTPPITNWRLFQLAFMVIQLPTLAAREHDLTDDDEYSQALRQSLEQVDVLWFPTGGGKTEAYLGLITTALFYDRLRGKGRGVTAWMRFPLRMLSLQQLERLARVLARAELVRAAESDLCGLPGDPFAVGYYVGGNNTPNRMREADIPKGAAAEKYLARQQILRHCPFCESDVKVKFDRPSWRLMHVCDNDDCYTNTALTLGELKGSLPLFVVDNEIYRYRPCVLVGTVDKLAVLGFQKHFAHLVSSVTQRCRRHGYASFGQCIENISGGPCTAKPGSFERLQREKDPVPAFLIQDELHLLKEELGTFNAHYEGFLHHLAEKQALLPSKILAATATIEAYEAQTFHLYLKDANRFPQPSWRAGESFYATSTPLTYRRLYCGVLTHQRSPDNAVLRTLEVYHRLIAELKERPAEALNTLGIVNVSEEEFLDFLRLYDLSLTYVNRKATGGNIAYGLNQSVSPRLPNALTVNLLTGDNTMTEVGEVIERIERERNDSEETRLDVLIATSLISHGVDLERLNFLCMAGMPSKFAEYIQASSRAARNHVGLVMVCFKRFDLRERSQYHYFLPNHRYLDRLVEPVPINRFSAFAAQRTVPGLLAGLLLSYYSRRLFDRRLITKSLDNLRQLKQMIDGNEITVKELNDDLEAIIGVHHPQLSLLQRRYLTEEIDVVLQTNWDQINRSYDAFLSEAIRPMMSFRDVDETIDFVADGATSVFVERVRS
jgi:hypothetical protein